MKYSPIIKKIDDLFGHSTFGHFLLYSALNILLPRSWHLKRELMIWNRTHKDHQCVLDSGSGLGQYSYMLSGVNKNWSVKGIDINEQLIAHCNQVFRKLRRENVLFKTADLTKSVANEGYDLAIAMDIAEFVEQDDEMFAHLYEALRYNGALFLYTHLIDAKNPNRKRSRFKLVEEQVRNGYSADEIKDKLKNAGFKRVKIRAVFGMSGNLSWNLSILIPLRLLNYSFLTVVILPFYYLLLFPLILVLNYIETHSGHLTGSAMFIKAYKDQ